MGFVKREGVYVNEDRYAQIFMKAYKKLSMEEQKVVMETKVNHNTRLYPEYLRIVTKLSNMVCEEDEDLGSLVYRKMLADIKIKADEDIEKIKEKMKSKVK